MLPLLSIRGTDRAVPLRAAAGYTSKVEVPMPRLTGPRHTHVSEDYRSLADVPATMVVVNVRDNGALGWAE